MDTIILYHGSPNKIVTPVFGGGDDKHDYGRGFYLSVTVVQPVFETALQSPVAFLEHILTFEYTFSGMF